MVLAAAFPGEGGGGWRGAAAHSVGGTHPTEAGRTALLAGTAVDGGARVVLSSRPRPRLRLSCSRRAPEGKAWGVITGVLWEPAEASLFETPLSCRLHLKF